MQSQDNYGLLMEKLDEFIRKYYKNKVLRGSLYSLASLFILFILITAIEYFAYLKSTWRAVIFFSFILFNTVVLFRWVIVPFFKIYRLGRIISDEEAAHIIGRHFTEIGDKLLNVLQLKKLELTNKQMAELITAGIAQKTAQLNPFSFKKAVNFGENKKYLKYVLPPLILIGLILLAAPSIITAPAGRLMHYNTTFEKPMPFAFNLLNKSMDVLQNEDFELAVGITGEALPAELYLETGDGLVMMQKINPSEHHYIFNNVQKNTSFRLYAAGFYSGEYTLNVLPRPVILSFNIKAVYPAYLNKKDEIFINTGDVTVPAGTQLQWHFNTRDTRLMEFTLNNTVQELKSTGSDNFIFSHRFLSGSTYSIKARNENVNPTDSMLFTVTVIPDAFPSVEVDEFRDSIIENMLFFSGQIKDDYGFKKLTFNCSVRNGNTEKKTQSLPVGINTQLVQQQFFYQLNVNDIEHTPGDVIEYYFEVWDNDGVQGSKSTRSRTMIYKTLSLEEVQEKSENNTEKLKNNMQAALKSASSLQKSIDELNRRLIDKKSLSWQDKQNIEQLLDKSKELQKKADDIQKMFENKENWENQFKELNEDILKKQEELNKLLEQLMSDDMKELMKELEKEMDKLDKDKVKNMLDKMKFGAKDVEKEIDRSLELFKQFEFEKKLSETIEKLDKMAEEQNKLSEKSEDKNADSKKLEEEQQKMNEQFDALKKDLDDLDKKNKELEKPNKFERTDEQQKSISEQMQNSSEQLQKKNNKKASQSQQKASEEMNKLSDKLKEMEQEMTQENSAEDIDALRDILENLLRSSFSQEALMQTLSKTRVNDPKYVALMQEQNKIKDDLKMIEDSLFALSKRQTQIQSFVNSEIADINSNIDKAVESLVGRNIQLANNRQQYVMTHINDLALMLNEAMQSMQMQMSQKSGSCNKSCNKPGQGKPSFKSMRQMQEALNKMLQDLKDGKQPQGKQSGGQSLSEQLARAAAQQEAIRNHLRSMADELKKQGLGNSKELDDLQRKMEQSESDIVNKMISRETINRQQEILTRLLEHEKAEMEREMEERRESNEAKNQKFSNPNPFFKYNNLKSKEEEILKTIPPSFRIFYKNKINEYFYNFQE